jgi:hypothetical protein
VCAALSRECVWGSADCSPRYEFRSGLKSTKFAIAGAKRKHRNFIEICHTRVEITVWPRNFLWQPFETLINPKRQCAEATEDHARRTQRRGLSRPSLIHMNGPSRIISRSHTPINTDPQGRSTDPNRSRICHSNDVPLASVHSLRQWSARSCAARSSHTAHQHPQ